MQTRKDGIALLNLAVQMNMDEDSKRYGWPPTGAPLNVPIEEQWSTFDSSVNAFSFGFVATAILITIFFVMAIFERVLRPTSTVVSPSGGRRRDSDIESQMFYNEKLSNSSTKMAVYANGVLVVMPGDEIASFIAQPSPMPCPPERNSWPSHQHDSLCCDISSSNLNPECMRNQHHA